MTLRSALAGLLLVALSVPQAEAIVGPSRTDPALIPYVVMVLNRSGNTAGYCSALVVAPTVALTAAHCVPQGAALKVHFRAPDGHPVLLDVASVVRNPGYRSDAIRTRQRSIDLALLRLASPLPAPFRAARRGDVRAASAGTAFRLAGFGLAREGEPTTSGVLRVADVVAREPASDVLLWAQDPRDQGAGACTGDSGGPVFAMGDDTAVALMAWSSGEGHAACGALTQAIWLGPQASWIEATLKTWRIGTLP